MNYIGRSLHIKMKNFEGVRRDLLGSLKDPEFCDVKIDCSDGEVSANKVILSMRSEYFRTMFSSSFKESRTNTVKMPYSKTVVEKMIRYIYSGNLNCDGLPLRSLMDLMELFNLMNFSEEFSNVEEFTNILISRGIVPLADCLKSVDVCSMMGLEAVEKKLLTHLSSNITQISEQKDGVQDLSERMIIRLIGNVKSSETIMRFRTLVTWLSFNSMSEETKEEALKLFDFNQFTVRELASDVKESGLYQKDKIIARMEEIIKEEREEHETIAKAKDKEIAELRVQHEDFIKAKDKEIAELQMQCIEIHSAQFNTRRQVF